MRCRYHWALWGRHLWAIRGPRVSAYVARTGPTAWCAMLQPGKGDAFRMCATAREAFAWSELSLDRAVEKLALAAGKRTS